LLGPNGAGKTTAIHTLCGRIDANGGEIRLFNPKQDSKNIEVRRHIGLVTQDLTIFKEQESANGAFGAVLTFMLMLSGAFLPLQFLPNILQNIGAIFPIFWTVRGLDALMDLGTFSADY